MFLSGKEQVIGSRCSQPFVTVVPPDPLVTRWNSKEVISSRDGSDDRCLATTSSADALLLQCSAFFDETGGGRRGEYVVGVDETESRQDIWTSGWPRVPYARRLISCVRARIHDRKTFGLVIGRAR